MPLALMVSLPTKPAVKLMVGVAAVVAGSTLAAERARAEGGEADDIDDLANIQELIRRELLEDDDDDNADDEE